MVHAPQIQIRWIVRNVCNSLWVQPFVSFHLLSPCPPLPTDNTYTLHCVSNCSPVVQFLRVASHCSSTANLKESLSVPGCQYCFTCARMAAKSWSELGMTCGCQHVWVYLLYLFISQCPPLAGAELQNIRRLQAVFLMKCKHPHSVISCVCTHTATSSELCILLMVKGCTQLQV